MTSFYIYTLLLIIIACSFVIFYPSPLRQAEGTVAFLWIPDVILEFLKEMLDEE